MTQLTHVANPVRVNATRIEEATEIRRRVPFSGQSLAGMLLRLADGRNYRASTVQLSRHIPVAGDYLVRREDGHEYLSAQDVFEREYTRIERPQ